MRDKVIIKNDILKVEIIFGEDGMFGRKYIFKLEGYKNNIKQSPLTLYSHKMIIDILKTIKLNPQKFEEKVLLDRL